MTVHHETVTYSRFTFTDKKFENSFISSRTSKKISNTWDSRKWNKLLDPHSKLPMAANKFIEILIKFRLLHNVNLDISNLYIFLCRNMCCVWCIVHVSISLSLSLLFTGIGYIKLALKRKLRKSQRFLSSPWIKWSLTVLSCREEYWLDIWRGKRLHNSMSTIKLMFWIKCRMNIYKFFYVNSPSILVSLSSHKNLVIEP